MRSLFRIVLFPGLTILSCALLLVNLNPDYRAAQSLAGSLNFILLFTTAFNVYSFSEWMIKDRATSFKSLLISMGMKRSSYNLANAACMLICILPITTAIAIISRIYIFEETQASFFAIILLFILFAIHLVGFTFSFVSFITSTSYVAIVFLLLFLENGVHLLAIILMKKTTDAWHPIILFIACLSPYEPVRIFCQSYMLDKNSGNTIFLDDKVSQSTHLILVAQTFWSIVTFAFAKWFEQVCPWQKDSAVRRPCFCCESKTHDEELAQSEELSAISKYFEHDTHNRDVGIQINHVTKSFNDIPAVNDVSFNIYKGETTLLLGHNGAGKSTLMNMVLGMLTTDRGTIVIRGKTNERPAVGVCPQASILDDDLNVQQHIELFVDIKSRLTGYERRHHIQQTIEDVSLTSHADKKPPELSGGMKRKLCLGMAFAGKSDVLILDEPSSGLDPDSRVFVWNAIRRYRADRTVLLSTQHMEEADYLGDRIAIMSCGQVICCGSSVFLKKLFGTGYKLRIECYSSKRKLILDHIMKYFSNSKQTDISSHSRESAHNSVTDLVVELQDDDKHKDSELELIKLLEDIENNSANLGIKSFGLKSSSIEDVMLETSKFFSMGPKESTQLTLTPTSGHIAALASSQQVPSFGGLLQVFLMKHIQTFLANWKSIIIFRLLIPAVGAWSAVGTINSTYKVYVPNLANVLMVFHFIYYPVLERVSKFKTMQLTSNANFITYWLSQAAIDFSTLITNVILMNSFFVWTIKSEVVSYWKLHLIITSATFMFGLAAMVFAYILSTVLSDPKTALGYHFLIYTSSIVVHVAVLLLKLILVNKLDITWLEDTLNYFFITLFSADAFQYILIGLSSNCYIKPDCKETNEFSPVIFGFLALFLQITLYSIVLYFVEARNLNLEWYLKAANIIPFCNKRKSPYREERQIDKDVVDETTKAISIIKNVPQDLYSLVAASLNKSYYKGVRVVEGLSFTVNKGECFGLLGVNGAGKSTTFSMLIAESSPDSGKIWANNYYSHERVDKYREKFGYDPQSNPELSLTPYQALCLMARLRKVNQHSVPMLVNSMLELLEMSQHAHKLANNLSGGTKRKLALGMALVGNPALLALDEPTAGVDPVARRRIWQLLKALRTQTNASIIISSHAMEECEAICDRISIMSRGRLRCIGTFLHLRSKFAQGCTLRIQFEGKRAVDVKSLNQNDHPNAGRRLSQSGSSGPASSVAHRDQVIAELQQRLESSIGSSVTLVDRNISSAVFSIADNSVKRSILFKIMRDFRQRHLNVSYMINDSSLEDIFISIAREQQEFESERAGT